MLTITAVSRKTRSFPPISQTGMF